MGVLPPLFDRLRTGGLEGTEPFAGVRGYAARLLVVKGSVPFCPSRAQVQALGGRTDLQEAQCRCCRWQRSGA